MQKFPIVLGLCLIFSQNADASTGGGLAQNYPSHIDESRDQFFTHNIAKGSGRSPLDYHRYVSEEFADQFQKTIQEGQNLQKNEELSPEDLQRAAEEKKAFLDRLYDVKSQTVYALKEEENPLLPTSSLLSQEDLKEVLQDFGVEKRVLALYDPNRLWRLSMRSFELPPARLREKPASLEEVRNSYREILDSMILRLQKRLEEDVLFFEMLTIMAGGGVKVDTTSFDKEEEELLKKLKSDYPPRRKVKAENVSSAEIFEEILQLYGYRPQDNPIPPKWGNLIFPEDLSESLFSRTCGALNKRSVVSWHAPEDQVLEVRVRQKLRQDAQADLTEELMESAYTILGRHLNKNALEVMTQNFGSVHQNQNNVFEDFF